MRIPIPGRRGQRGGGKLGPIIAILVAATVVYLLVKLIPPRIERAEFADFVERTTRESIVAGMQQEKLVDAIMVEATKVGIPIKEGDIRVSDSEQRVRVDIDYTKEIKLIGGKVLDQRFSIVADVPRI
jgi:hypothetical protein